MPTTDQEIHDAVVETLVEALKVDIDEIFEVSFLMADLGAESIDFLDIIFRLNRQLLVELPTFSGSVLAPFNNLPGDRSEYMNEEGELTAKGMEFYKTQFPYLDPADLVFDPTNVFRLDPTVAQLKSFVRHELDKQSA